MNRNSIKSLRPDIPNIKNQTSTLEIEKFQSEVLRPIAKYQNEIILRTFETYLDKFKLKLEGKPEDKEAIIIKAMKTNKELKSFYQGLISGMMTTEEFNVYQDSRNEINKRITSLITQRISSQMVS